MDICYAPNDRLPPLAWVATLPRDCDLLAVRHGILVETSERGFFEGAWAGDFGAWRPDLDEVAFGSGAIVAADEVRFISSLATTDYLFYAMSDEEELRIANSLPLLLAVIGDRLDPSFRGYANVNNTIVLGVERHERLIPTRAGSVRRLMTYNLHVGRDGRPREVAKPMPPHFANYAAYAAYLRGSYERLAANARDPRRRRPMRIYSTQSRGYDSTAVNALAAPMGLDGVFTVTQGKGAGSFADAKDERQVSDDGTEIAALLGVGPVIPLERRAFERGFADEVLYHAGIHECQDANLKQVTEHIVGPALLLTGTLGELWYTHACWSFAPDLYTDPSLPRGDLATHGLGEVRLHAGFVQVAVPYIGNRRRADVVAVTEAPEMAPWRLENRYDRPIPRRLAEEAGVPRELFGQTKNASVVEFSPPHIPQDPMLRTEYFAFLVQANLLWRWQIRLFPIIRRWNSMIWFANHWRYRPIYYYYRVKLRVLKAERRTPLWSGLRGSLYCFAVNWCVDMNAGALADKPAAFTPPVWRADGARDRAAPPFPAQPAGVSPADARFIGGGVSAQRNTARGVPDLARPPVNAR